MWLWDPDTLRVVAVNPAAIREYGFSREEWLARTLLDIRPLEDIPRVLEALGKLGPAESEAGVWRHRRKDGSVLHVRITAGHARYRGRPVRVARAVIVTNAPAQGEAVCCRTARQEERLHLSRELHDHFGQALVGLGFDLAALRTRLQDSEPRDRVNEMIHQIETLVAEIRLLTVGLRPPLLDELGVVDALAAHARDAARRAGLACEIGVHGNVERLGHGGGDRWGRDLVRIVSQALHNVMRHAHARSIRLLVHVAGDELTVRVEDDGRGVPTERGAGLGIEGMMTRARSHGGSVIVAPGEAGGTAVVVRLPIPQNGPIAVR